MKIKRNGDQMRKLRLADELAFKPKKTCAICAEEEKLGEGGYTVGSYY